MDEELGPVSTVLGTLGRIADVEQGRLEEVLALITETAARSLDVARVNVWLYDASRSQIECIEGFDTATNRHERGTTLRAAEFPSYFDAIERLRHVTAMNAEADPRTHELVESYLAPHGIGSMLDVPILSSGRVVGVVCHEHVGSSRVFTRAERLFAGSIGDLVALALETERRVKAEQERTRLIERLGQARRLESLGFLAAGVAHDLRNLLMVVTGNVEVLSQTATAPGVAAARDILEAVQRSRELCELLLTFSGRSEVSKRRVALGALVEETVRLLRGRAPRDVRVELDVGSSHPDVLGDPTSLRQVVMNLLINAFEALDGRAGTVRASVRESEPPNDLGFDYRAPGVRTLLLEIRDDGHGMTSETLCRVFEPFFTTKPNGHGLGLASVLGIARSHSGAVDIESTPSQGTTVRVWLPMASDSTRA